MASTGLPAGWYYEPADPSVGIFGDGFVHEDCERDDVQDAEQTWNGPTLTVTCACGATVELEEDVPDEPYWPEDE